MAYPWRGRVDNPTCRISRMQRGVDKVLPNQMRRVEIESEDSRLGNVLGIRCARIAGDAARFLAARPFVFREQHRTIHSMPTCERATPPAWRSRSGHTPWTIGQFRLHRQRWIATDKGVHHVHASQPGSRVYNPFDVLRHDATMFRIGVEWICGNIPGRKCSLHVFINQIVRTLAGVVMVKMRYVKMGDAGITAVGIRREASTSVPHS